MQRTRFPSSVPLGKRHSRQTEEMQPLMMKGNNTKQQLGRDCCNSQPGRTSWVKGQITRTVPSTSCFLPIQRPQKSCFPSHLPHQVGTAQLLPCSLKCHHSQAQPDEPPVPVPSELSPPHPTLLGCWRAPGKLPARTEMPSGHTQGLEKDFLIWRMKFQSLCLPSVWCCWWEPTLLSSRSSALLSHVEELDLNWHERHAQKQQQQLKKNIRKRKNFGLK